MSIGRVKITLGKGVTKTIRDVSWDDVEAFLKLDVGKENYLKFHDLLGKMIVLEECHFETPRDAYKLRELLRRSEVEDVDGVDAAIEELKAYFNKMDKHCYGVHRPVLFYPTIKISIEEIEEYAMTDIWKGLI